MTTCREGSAPATTNPAQTSTPTTRTPANASTSRGNRLAKKKVTVVSARWEASHSGELGTAYIHHSRPAPRGISPVDSCFRSTTAGAGASYERTSDRGLEI